MKILIRLPNWLGDVVMSTAFVKAVLSYYPEALVDVVIKKELAGVASLIPGVRTVHSFSKQEYKGLSGTFKFGKKLRFEKYDLFFNLPESLSSLVLGWATAAKTRVGFNKEGGWFLLTKHYKKPKNIHRVEEYVSLLENFTGKLTPIKLVGLTAQKPQKLLAERVIINFNSEASSRRMPVEKAAAIINLLTKIFNKTEFVFIGSQKEVDFIDEVFEKLDDKGRIKNFAGKTNLTALVELLADCDVLLTTDSGPAHLANAVGTPTIVLFGAGNEFNTAPYNKQNLNIIRYGKLNCEPCLKNTCELYGVPKCLELIDELTIVATLGLFLPTYR